jgi:hypothetical protein
MNSFEEIFPANSQYTGVAMICSHPRGSSTSDCIIVSSCWRTPVVQGLRRIPSGLKRFERLRCEQSGWWSWWNLTFRRADAPCGLGSNHKNADVFVLRASTRFECLATNSIGGEPMNASLAVSDGEIFIRTDKHLWCIGRDTGNSSHESK